MAFTERFTFPERGKTGPFSERIQNAAYGGRGLVGLQPVYKNQPC